MAFKPLIIFFVMAMAVPYLSSQIPEPVKSVESEIYRQKHSADGYLRSRCVPKPPEGWEIIYETIRFVVTEVKHEDLVAWSRSSSACFTVKTDGIPLRDGEISFKFTYQIRIIAQANVNELHRLPDSEKLQTALDDAAVAEPSERMPLQAIDTNSPTIRVGSLKSFSEIGNCVFSPDEVARYKRNGIYVFKPDELVASIEAKREEFAGNEERRLKQLLGLRPEDPYKCFIEIEVDPKQLIRPSLNLESTKTGDDYFFLRVWGGKYPFTGLGYTCDWYYGDGCRYGMSEFNIPPNKGWISERSYT